MLIKVYKRRYYISISIFVILIKKECFEIEFNLKLIWINLIKKLAKFKTKKSLNQKR